MSRWSTGRSRIVKQLSRFEWQGGGRDEWYTPAEAVKPILKHLKPGAKVLCPFDTPESNFVKILTKNGFKVFTPIYLRARTFSN